MGLYNPKDTQNDRRYQKLHDQHGRMWGCVIEMKTGDPTGNIDLIEPSSAPLIPPVKFLKVDSRREFARLTIDYDGWIKELDSAWDFYNDQMLRRAREMYGDAAAEKVENPPPALIAEVGIPPAAVEPVLAAQAGEKWVLGLSADQPKWAAKFFAPKRAPEVVKNDRLAFMGDELPQDDTEPESEYPVFVKPAGRGQSLWTLQDGSEFKGTKAEAVEANNGATHESWGD